MHDRTPGATPRTQSLLAIALAALLGLAACGGGGDDAQALRDKAGGGTTAGNPAPAPSPAPGAANPATISYRLTWIGPKPNSTGVVLNAKGQVAGYYVGESARGGFFYNGTENILYASPSGDIPAPSDLNNAGQVVGHFAHEGGAQEAFSWTKAGGLVRIAPLSATVLGSNAHDVNELGQVVGTLETPSGPRGFLWSATTGLVTTIARDFPMLKATRINDAGLVAGVGLVGGVEKAVLVDSRTGATVFERSCSAAGPVVAEISHLNEAGAFAGTLDAFDARAFLGETRSGCTLHDVGSLIAGQPFSYVQALNDQGQMLVSTIDLTRAFFWSRAKGLVEIEAAKRFFLLMGSINEHGVAVGIADRPDASRDEDVYALAWTADGGAVDLNTRVPGAPAGLLLRSGRMINDSGQILVFAEGGERSTVLLTPVTGTP
ncbi:hypothetical protein [Caldimonas tepidiphila]|uniref:hypothetical protein n=1 Tax=Caldimonas tepidiphila TaxID=2315841 RepID=UPI000E5AED38|nr:hypothetical protein [Caldimonas tepidiphila]